MNIPNSKFQFINSVIIITTIAYFICSSVTQIYSQTMNIDSQTKEIQAIDKTIIKEVQARKVASVSEINTVETDRHLKTNPETKYKFPLHSLIIGVIGALIGLIPYFWEQVKPAKLEGKVISWAIYPKKSMGFESDIEGNIEMLEGVGYKYRFNLVSNKNIRIKNVKTWIYLQNEYKPTQIYFLNNEFSEIDPDFYLQFTPNFVANKSYDRYLTYVLKNETMNPSTEIESIFKKMESNLPLTKNEERNFRRSFTPRKIKLEIFDYRNKRRTLEIDIDKEYDFYSVIPQQM